MQDVLHADIVPLARVSRVRISALALLKMAMHARSGGNLEIMGMLQVSYLSAHTRKCFLTGRTLLINVLSAWQC